MLLVTAPTSAAAPDLPQGALLVRQLYSDFDPRREPLDIEVIREWDERGIHIEQLYFTGQVFGGVKTRVYAYRAAPLEGGRLPGILHCHGGGQTAYLDWVRFWARRGYVCVSFDYSGDTNKYNLPEYVREHFTRWGDAVDSMIAGRPSAKPGMEAAKGSNWYHFCLAARRALTLLETHPRVDRARLGAFGVSAGGYLCWLLAGTDSRVKTIVPIYGHGGGAFRDENGRPVQPDAALEREVFQKSPDAPALYAPNITCPVLYMSATNDGSFNMDTAPDTLGRLRSDVVRMLYSPRCSHHIRPQEGRVLPLWMDWQLKGKGKPWPDTPAVEVTVSDGVPQVRVRPDAPGDVAGVEIYYALNNTWGISRFWRDAEGIRKDGEQFVGSAPFMAPGDRIFAMANVIYRSGVRLSSPVADVPASSLAGAKPTLRPEALIDDMKTQRYWYWVPAYPDPKIYEDYFIAWKGPKGEQGFTVRPFESENPPFVEKDGTLKYNFGTHMIGDPQCHGTQKDKALLIDYYGPRAPRDLKVTLVVGPYGPSQTAYTLQGMITPNRDGWVTLRLEPGQFADAEGRELPSWRDVRFVGLSGASPKSSPPVFRNVRWERGR